MMNNPAFGIHPQVKQVLQDCAAAASHVLNFHKSCLSRDTPPVGDADLAAEAFRFAASSKCIVGLLQSPSTFIRSF